MSVTVPLRFRAWGVLWVGLLVACLPTAAEAQAPGIEIAPDVALAFSGGIQPRVAYGVQEGEDASERFGFGLRRARFQARVSYQNRLGVEYDVDAATGAVQSVELFGFWQATDQVEVRFGRVAGAQPRGYTPTSNTEIDAVDRAAIVERWAAGTIGSSGRDFGMDVRYQLSQTLLELFVHNGAGGFSRDRDNFCEGVSAPSVTRGTDETGLAISAAVRHRLAALGGVEVGAFAGVNTAGNERTVYEAVERSYATGSAHLYWGATPGSQPVRLKADLVGTRYEAVGGYVQEAVGLSGLGAVRVLRFGEAFARAEHYWDDLDGEGDTYLTTGVSYSLSAARGRPHRQARVTLAYALRDAPEIPVGVPATGADPAGDAHLVVLQGQLTF